MDMTINQQVALDEALVPHANRLRIGKSNFHVPEIYMQEFWATATVYHHLIRFKMNNKKRIVNLKYVREMLHICPRIPNQTFDELPFKEEILAFLRYLGHSGEIKKITDVTIVFGYLKLKFYRGMYHKKNVDFAYLLWEDFVYQVEHKDAKKRNEMYYPRFTKVIINFFMTKDPSIPRRNKFGAILPVELTNKDIRNSASYKEYYVIALGAAPPKTKASVRKTQSSYDTTMSPPTAVGIRPSTSAKGIQPAKSSKAKDEGTGIIPWVPDVPTDESDEEISWKSSDEDDDDDSWHECWGRRRTGCRNDDEELYRDVNINLEGHDVQMTDVHTTQVLEDTHVILTPVNPDGQQQSLSMSSQFVTSMFNLSPDAYIDYLFESTPWVDVPVMITVVPLLVTAPTVPLHIMLQVQQAPTTTPSTSLQDRPNLGSLFGFDDRLKTLEANFSEFMQTNQFAGAISSILGIVERYIDHQMNEAVKVAVQIQIIKEQVKVQVSKILPKIKKTVNEQLEAEVLTRSSNSSKTSYAVAADLSELELKKILIKKMESNKSIHRSDEQRNLYKALVDAYECDKIILDTYGDTVMLKIRRDDADKDEEPSVGSDRWSKRRREGKEPESTSAPKEKSSKTTGKSIEGSKSHQKIVSESAPAEEPIQTTQDLEEPSHQEFETGANEDQPVAEASQHPKWFQKQKKPPTLDHTLTPEFLAGPTYELMKRACKSRHVIPFDHFINNDLEYLCGGSSSRKYTTSVMKTTATDYGQIKWIEDLVPRTMWSQSPVIYDKYDLWGISHWERKRQQFYGFAVNRESARDVYSKRRIITVTELQIVKWYNYKHLDWITVRRDNDKLYKFKEGDLKRLHIQDIEDMLLLLVQGKLTNLTVEERFAFNVSLRMFTRSIVIQRRVEDL
nr:hypothetical protein [Tanacetum cinerariifolium]